VPGIVRGSRQTPINVIIGGRLRGFKHLARRNGFISREVPNLLETERELALALARV